MDEAGRKSKALLPLRRLSVDPSLPREAVTVLSSPGAMQAVGKPDSWTTTTRWAVAVWAAAVAGFSGAAIAAGHLSDAEFLLENAFVLNALVINVWPHLSGRSARKAARAAPGGFVGPDDLDPRCQDALRGVQDLVDSIAGALDRPDPLDLARLAEEEFAIAVNLKELTGFRHASSRDITHEDHAAEQELMESVDDSIATLRDLAREILAADQAGTAAAEDAIPLRDVGRAQDLRASAAGARSRANGMNALIATIRAFPGSREFREIPPTPRRTGSGPARGTGRPARGVAGKRFRPPSS